MSHGWPLSQEQDAKLLDKSDMELELLEAETFQTMDPVWTDTFPHDDDASSLMASSDLLGPSLWHSAGEIDEYPENFLELPNANEDFNFNFDCLTTEQASSDNRIGLPTDLEYSSLLLDSDLSLPQMGDITELMWNQTSEPDMLDSQHPEPSDIMPLTSAPVPEAWEDANMSGVSFDFDIGLEIEVQTEAEFPNLFGNNSELPSMSSITPRNLEPQHSSGILSVANFNTCTDQNQFIRRRNRKRPSDPEDAQTGGLSAIKRTKRELLECNECGKCFVSNKTLKQHGRTAHKQYPAILKADILQQAGKFLRTPKIVLERTRLPALSQCPKKPNPKQNCNVWNYNTQIPSKTPLRVPEVRCRKTGVNSTYEKPAPVKCTVCDKLMSGDQSLKQHQVLIHNMKLENWPSYQRVKMLKTRQRCFCGHVSINIYHLRAHQRIKHNLNLPRVRGVWKHIMQNAKFIPSVEIKGNDVINLSSKKMRSEIGCRMKKYSYKRIKPPKKIQRCDICNDVVDGSMSSHKISTHDLTLRSQRYKYKSLRQSVKCSVCLKIMRKQYLNNHMSKSHGGSKIVKRHVKQSTRLRNGPDSTRVKGNVPEDLICREQEDSVLESEVTPENEETQSEQLEAKLNTHNSDLSYSQLKWMRHKVAKSDKLAETYTHLLTKTCVVSIVDLRETFSSRRVRKTPSRKISTLNKEICKSASNHSSVPSPTSSLPELGYNDLERISSVSTDTSQEAIGIPVIPDYSDANCEIVDYPTETCQIIQTVSTPNTATPIESLTDTNTEDIDIPDTGQSAHTSPPITTVSQPEIPLVHPQSADEYLNRDVNENFIRNPEEDMALIIQEKLIEMIEEIATDIPENAAVVELNTDVISKEECQTAMDCSFEAEVRIDDADLDYEYMDAVAEQEAQNNVTDPVTDYTEISPDFDFTKLPSPDIDICCSILEELEDTSHESKCVSKEESEQLANPNRWKVLLKDAGMTAIECKVCDEMVPCKFMERHKKIDHILECHICLKPVHMNEMKNHGPTHVGNLYCDLCNYKSATRTQLWEHMNTHLGVRPVICDICGKAFASTSNLRRHNLTFHDNITHTQFKCELCEMAFPTSARKYYHKQQELKMQK